MAERPEISPDALASLRKPQWPGNVRELRNLLARLVLLSPGRIDAQAVARALSKPETTSIFPPSLLSREEILKTLTLSDQVPRT